MGIKLIEFCMKHGWNHEIVIAILETIMILSFPTILMLAVFYIISKE